MEDHVADSWKLTYPREDMAATGTAADQIVESEDEEHILWKVFPLDKIRSSSHSEPNGKRVTSTLLLGPRHSCKTSLLFQAAVTHCETSRSGVLFVTRKPMSDLPRPVHGMPRPTKNNMTHLQFAYVDGSSEFVKFLASFHQVRNTAADFNPTLICVDGFDQYVERTEDNDNQLAKTLALLQDVAYFLSLKGKSRCRLFVTCTKTELCANSLNILNRFFDRTWNLRAAAQEQEGETRNRWFALNRTIDRTTFVDCVAFQQKGEQIHLLSLKLRNLK